MAVGLSADRKAKSSGMRMPNEEKWGRTSNSSTVGYIVNTCSIMWRWGGWYFRVKNYIMQYQLLLVPIARDAKMRHARHLGNVSLLGLFYVTLVSMIILQAIIL